MRLTGPHRGRRTHRVLAIIAAPALVAGLASPTNANSASASEQGDSEVNATPSRTHVPYKAKSVNRSKSRMARLREYWTPERMANAVPADRITRRAMAQQTKASRVRPKRVKPTTLSDSVAPTVRTSGARRRVRKSKTIGKVFFRTRKGVNMVCSAAAVNSKRKNMVMTAGHCVHGGRGKRWHKRWIFVPGYGPKRRTPHGIYPATTLVTLKGWIRRSNFNFDVAIALVKPGRGTNKKVVRKVGGYGLQTGKSYRRRLAAVGYSSLGYSGKRQKHCRRRTHRLRGTRQLEMRCKVLTPGASGGPWIKGRVRIKSRKHSHINGVNSNANRRRHPTKVRSPYFGRAVRRMYRAYRKDRN